jgi:hypothetical protein
MLEVFFVVVYKEDLGLGRLWLKKGFKIGLGIV